MAALIAGATLAAAAAETAPPPQPPLFWDANERLPRPDLSALPRLRFLTTTDFPPFNFIDGQGRLSGFHVDLARAICAELDIADKCQIQALPWTEMEDALNRGDGEAIIAGVAVTADSREKYAFSRSYLQFPARFVTLKAKAMAEPIYDRLQGMTVGVLGGSGHERMLHDYFGAVHIIAYDQPEALYADLKSGKIGAAFGDGLKLSFWLAGTDAAGCCAFAGSPYLAPEYLGTGLAIATKPGDDQLVAAFNYALQQISIKGVFAELYLRYFPVSFY